MSPVQVANVARHSSTVTLLSVGHRSPGWEATRRSVPVIDAGFLGAAQHSADFRGDLPRIGWVELQQPREHFTHLRHG